MKTFDLYLSILKDVRYNVMSNPGITLNDFAPDSNGYKLLVSFNEVANMLSDLIHVMEYEAKC